MSNLRRYFLLGAAFLLLTVLLGLGLRWEFVTGWFSRQGIFFPDLRHAHSHAGYYGVLVLALWAAMRAEGLYIFHRWGLLLYGGLSAASVGLFAFHGYSPTTIVLSTLILGYWLVAAWMQIRSRTGAISWLDVAPWNMMVGATLVIPIALTASSEPAFSASLAHLFVTLLLLGVFVPAAWAALGIARRTSRMFFSIFALGASLFFAFPEESGFLGQVFVVGYAIAILNVGVRRRLGWIARVYWILFAVGVGAAVGWEPLMDYRTRIAAIHFVILGPVLTSFVNAFWKVHTRPALVFAGMYHILLLTMSLAVMRPEWIPVGSPATLAPWVSTLFVINLVPLLVFIDRGVRQSSPAQGGAGDGETDGEVATSS